MDLKTEHQLKIIRAAANELLTLKRQPRFAPALKGLPIAGMLRQSEQSAQAVRLGFIPEAAGADILRKATEALTSLRRALLGR